MRRFMRCVHEHKKSVSRPVGALWLALSFVFVVFEKCLIFGGLLACDLLQRSWSMGFLNSFAPQSFGIMMGLSPMASTS